MGELAWHTVLYSLLPFVRKQSVLTTSAAGASCLHQTWLQQQFISQSFSSFSLTLQIVFLYLFALSSQLVQHLQQQLDQQVQVGSSPGQMQHLQQQAQQLLQVLPLLNPLSGQMAVMILNFTHLVHSHSSSTRSQQHSLEGLSSS